MQAVGPPGGCSGRADTTSPTGCAVRPRALGRTPRSRVPDQVTVSCSHTRVRKHRMLSSADWRPPKAGQLLLQVPAGRRIPRILRKPSGGMITGQPQYGIVSRTPASLRNKSWLFLPFPAKFCSSVTPARPEPSQCLLLKDDPCSHAPHLDGRKQRLPPGPGAAGEVCGPCCLRPPAVAAGEGQGLDRTLPSPADPQPSAWLQIGASHDSLTSGSTTR